MRTKLRLMTPASLWARKLNSTLIPSEPSVVANQHSFYGTENSSCFVETDSQFQNPRHTFCILVHDEWGRSLRTGKDSRPLKKYQDDRTLCEAGAPAIARTSSTARETWKLLEPNRREG